MSSSSGDDDDDECPLNELGDELVDVGFDLLDNRKTVTIDQLLLLIQKVQMPLEKVWQLRPKNAHELIPVMTALITDEVLRNTDANIQIAVACCMNEIIRITAPQAPYDPEFMKAIFPLFLVALKQLSSESASDYEIPLRILETVASVKTYLLMIDEDCEETIVEMFRLFLDSIRSDHPVDTFKYMKIIMTSVIQESDEISFELLKPLLLSARLENKNVSPLSRELATTVIQKCARKVRPHVRAAVQKINLDLDEYPEIVIALCQDPSKGRYMLDKEVSAPVSKIDMFDKDEVCTPGINESNENISDDRNMSQTASFDSEETHVAEIDQLVIDKGTIQRRKGRKPAHISQDEDSSPFFPGESSRKERSSINRVSLHKKGTSQKGVVVNEDNSQEWSSSIRKKILQSKVKVRGSSATKKGKRIIGGSSQTGTQEEEGFLNSNGRERKLELLREERRKSKSSTLHKQESNDVGNKIVGSSSKPPKAKTQKNLSQEKGKKTGKSLVDYGEELVNSRIMVWWPMDKTFYPGTVKAFDPVSKKHKILYDDDESETLNLKVEKWKLVNDKQPHDTQSSQHEGAELPPPSKESVKSQEKPAKRKRGSSSKQQGASSSKKLKSESRSMVSSGQSAAPDAIDVIDKTEDKETLETTVSPKYDSKNCAEKEEAGTSNNQIDSAEM